MIIKLSKEISPDAVNTGGNAVYIWTGLLIDLIYNYDITQII